MNSGVTVSVMTATLWHLELSHYNEKARWALAYKGIAHARRTPMPGFTGPVALALTRGRSRRLPILQLDGRTIADSTAIIAALEECRPDPPLYPAGPALRSRALALEDYFDEHLAPALRQFVWHHTLADSDAVLDSLFTTPHPVRRRMIRATAPAAGLMIRKDFAISEATAATALRTLREAMDRIESELDGGEYLVGDAFSVADLAGAALFTPLLQPPKREFAPPSQVPVVAALREELEARPGGRWVHEMFARHR